MKTLLVIGYVWPEPKSSAAGSRMLELIELFLAQQWRVVFASAAAISEHRFDLKAIGVEEKSVLLNDSAFNEYIAELMPDAVLFDRFFTEEQFGWRVEQECPQAIRILDTEDLHSLRHARHVILKQNQKKCDTEVARHSLNPVLERPEQLFAHMAEDDMAKREVAAIFRCDLSLMISSFEIDLLTRYFSVPKQLLHYAPFLNLQNQTASPTFSERQNFISIGNFRHEPNWDAVLYLKHAIWPLIRAQLPQAEMHVYGAYPPPKATQLHNPKQGFWVKGWAQDAHEVMRQARVCLAPLRFGAGIKGKLIDAMQCGTPSVTTSIGAEAMSDGDLWGGAIADDAESFSEAAVSLYTHEHAWNEAQQNGFSNRDNFFRKENYQQNLTERIIDLQNNLPTERKNNFIGAMLRHHSLKSTQYMSQWIEAKNKK